MASIASTWRIWSTTTRVGRWLASSASVNLRAAPKQNEPLISNTSTPDGIACGWPSSGAPVSYSSTSRTAFTCVTSAMRRMNKSDASTTPTWIATVRFTATVSANVAISTSTSLRGARNRRTNTCHSLML